MADPTRRTCVQRDDLWGRLGGENKVGNQTRPAVRGCLPAQSAAVGVLAGKTRSAGGREGSGVGDGFGGWRCRADHPQCIVIPNSTGDQCYGRFEQQRPSLVRHASCITTSFPILDVTLQPGIKIRPCLSAYRATNPTTPTTTPIPTPTNPVHLAPNPPFVEVGPTPP